jgi:hypothetical protein
MKPPVQSIIRIGVSSLLAVPFYLVGTTGRFAPMLIGYLLAVALYWAIQAITKFRHPFHGLLFAGLFSVLYALLLPARVRERTLMGWRQHPTIALHSTPDARSAYISGAAARRE